MSAAGDAAALWQVEAEVPAAFAGAVGELAFADALAVSEFMTPDPARRRLAAVYDMAPDLEAIAALLQEIAPDAGAPVLADLPAEDWVGHSNRIRAPFRIGGFLLYGEVHRHDRPAARWPLEIEAAQAFGTGRAPSTGLCMLAIALLAGARGRPGRRVLDLGCGSGVLGIGAARAWHAQVNAADIDPVAVRIAAENARLNGVGMRMRCSRASSPAMRALHGPRPYDAIFANILSGPLIAMAPGIARLCGPQTLVVLAGLLNREARRVAAAYRAQGLVLRRELRADGWSALLLSRAPLRLPLGPAQRAALPVQPEA